MRKRSAIARFSIFNLRSPFPARNHPGFPFTKLLRDPEPGLTFPGRPFANLILVKPILLTPLIALCLPALPLFGQEPTPAQVRKGDPFTNRNEDPLPPPVRPPEVPQAGEVYVPPP